MPSSFISAIRFLGDCGTHKSKLSCVEGGGNSSISVAGDSAAGVTQHGIAGPAHDLAAQPRGLEGLLARLSEQMPGSTARDTVVAAHGGDGRGDAHTGDARARRC